MLLRKKFIGEEKRRDKPMHSDDMSPRIARLLELHLANGTLVVVVLHCQMRIRNHFRVILRLFGHLHENNLNLNQEG